MGVKLMVEVLDHCPDGLTLGERLLLVALAEKADDQTRRVIWARNENARDVLRRRLGVSDSGLTKVFARLASHGLDPRVAIGTDKRGRPVFAYEGTAVEYVIPFLRACPAGQALVDNLGQSLPDGATSAGVEPARRGDLYLTTGEALESERLPDGATHVPPSLESPSIDARESQHDGVTSDPLGEVPPDQRTAVVALLARLGGEITEADAVDCVAWVAETRTPNNLSSYLQRFTPEDVRTRAAERRDGRRPADSRMCDHGLINGRAIRGRGANASRICPSCEQLSPAPAEPDLAQERAS